MPRASRPTWHAVIPQRCHHESSRTHQADTPPPGPSQQATRPAPACLAGAGAAPSHDCRHDRCRPVLYRPLARSRPTDDQPGGFGRPPRCLSGLPTLGSSRVAREGALQALWMFRGQACLGDRDVPRQASPLGSGDSPRVAPSPITAHLLAFLAGVAASQPILAAPLLGPCKTPETRQKRRFRGPARA